MATVAVGTRHGHRVGAGGGSTEVHARARGGTQRNTRRSFPNVGLALGGRQLQGAAGTNHGWLRVCDLDIRDGVQTQMTRTAVYTTVVVRHRHGVVLSNGRIHQRKGGIVFTHRLIVGILPSIDKRLCTRHRGDQMGRALTVTNHVVADGHHRQGVHRHRGVQFHVTAVAVSNSDHIGSRFREVL